MIDPGIQAEIARLSGLGVSEKLIADILQIPARQVTHCLDNLARRAADQAETLPKTRVRRPRPEADLTHQQANGLCPDDAARATLAQTGGRYQALTAWASEHRLTYTQALQRWHLLGLPLQREKS